MERKQGGLIPIGKALSGPRERQRETVIQEFHRTKQYDAQRHRPTVAGQ